MATVNSVEYGKIAGLASSYDLLMPNQLGGRVRGAVFTKKTPTGTGLAINDLLALTKIPKGARIIAILAQWEAMTTGAGAASGEIGTSDDPDFFVAAMSFDAAGALQLLPLRLDVSADEPALGNQHELAADTVVYLKAVTEAWAADKYIRGVILYMLD